MKLLFELSKEHSTLPTDEVLSCLEAEGVRYNCIDSNENALAISANIGCDKIKRLSERLSLTFSIDELLFSCLPSVDEIKKHAETTEVSDKGTLAVRYRNRSEKVDSQPIVEALAEVYTKDRPVDLTNPDSEIRVLITDPKVYVGLKKAEVDRKGFEKRKVQYRPFFSPVSLHPKIARTLVNLSCVKKNEKLLDPFCGTGGILLEAGFIGANVIGSDVEEKMIEGCRETLDFYGVKRYELFCSDVGEITDFVSEVDAVVTDLPYGKSTTTRGEDIEALYNRAFENLEKVLKRGGKAVVGLSESGMMHLGEEYLYLLKSYEFKVHRSLTRYFGVFKK
jgi:tRNA (guanine10-N2)-dimethyltransferase